MMMMMMIHLIISKWGTVPDYKYVTTIDKALIYLSVVVRI